MTISPPRPPLARPRHAVIAGVSEALAAHLRWPVRRVRFWLILTTVFGGAGILMYFWLWAFVPLELADKNDPTVVSRRVPVAALLLIGASISGLVAMAYLRTGEGLATVAIVALIAGTGAAVAWNLTLDRHDPRRSARYGLGVRVASAVLPLLVGSVALSGRPNAINAVLGVTMVVLGVAVLVAPRVVTLWSELMEERAARVRQEQRSEIAAHLHDSVLQTLALIQNRAGPSSEVARIARAQERELRDWLFATGEPDAADLATQLREIAAAIELDYAVRIEVVTAGETANIANASLVAAAREAMLNAARHAGGDVSVYIEATPTATDVFVRDRGPGVDLDALPADRLGIRESIIGRMSRAGGSATVRPGAGGSGTQVHLRLEVPHD
ncbi:MAG TPA: PspC domain-containing protein [Glaciihabitans sp.]|nr:PspC domain-containing protein [Glaciihabitans sp.]